MTATVLSRIHYHHGDLRAVMVGTAIRMLAEPDREALSVREVARRSGVSSGAPFHHFPTRRALMTAVAEAATRQLRQVVEDASAAIPEAKASRRLRAVTRAWLRWVVANPAQFKVMSETGAIDHSDALERDNAAMWALLRDTLRAAMRDKVSLGLDQAMLELRAMSYGLARMFVDGQLTQTALMEAAMDDVLARLTGRKSA